MRFAMLLAAALGLAALQPARSGNPIFPGWYADPEAHVFQHEYWIYPTYSAFDDKGMIRPVKITITGVAADPLSPAR